MGTRWRGLLAPIDKPTGDGRRMAKGAITHRELPLPLKWQRQDEEGHDASVVVGLMDTLTVDEKAGEVWGEGELFDDIDARAMPRLAEDVAEAKHLTAQGVIGPSVDAGAAEVMLVVAGTDAEPTEDEWDQIMMGAEGAPELELLFVEYQIAAATLVPIPAFGQCRPFELVTEAVTAADGGELAAGTAEVALTASATLARVAALTAAAPTIPADVFTLPEFAEYTDITVEDRGEGFLRVAGHFAPHQACHLEFRDICVTPPLSAVEYVPFHRYPIQTDDGELLGVGRITTGFGRVGTGCRCCRGKDDHACTRLSLTAAVSHHDGLTTLAWVRAWQDEHGQGVVGIAHPDLSDDGRAVLSGRKFSGDWREHGGHLELVELLALTAGKPAFPAPKMSLRAGRRVSLTACFSRPSTPAPPTPPLAIDYPLLAQEIVGALATQNAVLSVSQTATPSAAAPETVPPVGEPAPGPAGAAAPAEQATALAAEIEQAAAEDRARQAAALADQLAAVV